MNKEFKVSIIVNCHNGEKYLSRCLKSILNQTMTNWEVIFFDNQSQDSSKRILKQFKDKRFKYFLSTKFLKLYDARNEAIKKSSGEFLAFLDCDDWWEVFHLENAINFFRNKKIGFYFANAFNYLENKNKYILHRIKLPNTKIFDNLVDDYCVKISSLILRKDILDKNRDHIFNKNFNIIGDFELIMNLASKYQCISNNTPSVFCSFHGDNYSLKNRDEYVHEFNSWYKNIDFTNQKYLLNKAKIQNNLIYINLFNNITKKKKFKFLFEIFKVTSISKKIKLLIIFCMPFFLIKKFLNKY